MNTDNVCALQARRHFWKQRFDQVLCLALGSQALRQTKTRRWFLHPVEDSHAAHAACAWLQPTSWLCCVCPGTGTHRSPRSNSAKPSPLQVTHCGICRYKAENTAQKTHLSSSKRIRVVTSKILKLQVTTADLTAEEERKGSFRKIRSSLSDFHVFIQKTPTKYIRNCLKVLRHSILYKRKQNVTKNPE